MVPRAVCQWAGASSGRCAAPAQGAVLVSRPRGMVGRVTHRHRFRPPLPNSRGQQAVDLLHPCTPLGGPQLVALQVPALLEEPFAVVGHGARSAMAWPSAAEAGRLLSADLQTT